MSRDSETSNIVELAVAYLESKGYTVLERNYFFEDASVDLVVYEGILILFVLVEEPEEIHDPIPDQKQREVFKASEAWLYERKMDNAPARFDVVTVRQTPSGTPEINHIENAFHPSD